MVNIVIMLIMVIMVTWLIMVTIIMTIVSTLVLAFVIMLILVIMLMMITVIIPKRVSSVHLGSGLPGRLCLSGHRPLQLDWEPSILAGGGRRLLDCHFQLTLSRLGFVFHDRYQ